MMDDAYRGDFSSWADVVEDFRNLAPTVEPEAVLWAEYRIDGYEGSALVIFRQGDQVFEVEGSHCSCFGLEDHWQPEQYDIPTYIAAVEKRGVHAGEGREIAAGKLRLLLNG